MMIRSDLFGRKSEIIIMVIKLCFSFLLLLISIIMLKRIINKTLIEFHIFNSYRTSSNIERNIIFILYVSRC